MLLTWEHFIRFLWHEMIHCISMRTSQSAVLRWYRFSWANNENSFHRSSFLYFTCTVSFVNGQCAGWPKKKTTKLSSQWQNQCSWCWGNYNAALFWATVSERPRLWNSCTNLHNFWCTSLLFFYLIAYCIVLNMYLVFTFTSCFIQSVATWWKATTY